MTEAAFDPTGTYLHLAGGRAEAIVVDDHFWSSVIAGERRLDGWLAGSYTYEPGASTHSERHPAGDEIHLCQSGAVVAVLEHESGDEAVAVGAGQVCVIPAGVWHRVEAAERSRVFTLTFGQGTEHRPGPAMSRSG